MSRTSRWLTPLSLVATASLILTACGASATVAPATPAPATPAPASAAPASVAPPSEAPSAAAFTPQVYPATAVDCKNPPKGYTGQISQIKALDASTVEFDLCQPDVAFLSKIATPSFAIMQKDWLAKAIADGSYVDHPNGTGPYTLQEWVKGDHMTFAANPSYWGTAPVVPTAILRWSTEAAQRLTELQAGTVDGIDNVGTDDFKTVQNDSTLKLYPRPGLNVFYLGMNVVDKPWDNEKVRQAISYAIDRKRIVDNFYPPGTEVATHFTPCAIPGACEGPDWPAYDPVKAKQLLTAAGFPNGFTTKIQMRDVVRPYLPDPKSVATDIQAQLKKNLNITATIDIQESATFIDNNSAGKLDGLFMLGWSVDYPDVTDFLDFHFGSGSGAKFGKPFADIAADLTKGASSADQSARNAAYADANTLLEQHVPMIPIAHGGNAMAYRADVEGAYSSPTNDELFATMKPAGRNQLVIMQNAEPNSLYCADETDGETLRACEQIYEPLYNFKPGSSDIQPLLATGCTANSDLTVWTCTLRSGVKFSDGSVLDANDVVTTFAALWDAANPLHKGRTSAFENFGGFFGGFLNPPAQ
jgi:peptide/nickel transport system substrate-binding protein